MRVDRICLWLLAALALAGEARALRHHEEGPVGGHPRLEKSDPHPERWARRRRNRGTNRLTPQRDFVFRPRLNAQDGTMWVQMSTGGPQFWLLDNRGSLWSSSEDGLQFFPRDFAHIHSSAMPQNSGLAPMGNLADGLSLTKDFGYLSVNLMVLQYQSKLLLRFNSNDMFKFPYGTTGEPYLEFTPDSPAFWSAIWAGVPRPGSWSLRDSGPFMGQGFQRAAPVAVPQLPKFLALSASKQGDVAWMASEHGIWRVDADSDAPILEWPCPDLRCPAVVSAVDGGFVSATEHEIVRYFDGRPMTGAVITGIRQIVVDPADESHLFFVTENEIFESVDEGFHVQSIFVLPAGNLHSVTYSPDYNQIIIASSTGVFWGTPGRGLQSIPELDGRRVTSLALERGARGRVYIAIGNDVFTWDGASQNFALFQRLPESILQLYSPGSDQLWVLTSTQLSELQPKTENEISPAQKAWAQKILSKEPSLWMVLESAYRRHVPRPSRQRLAWAPYLPRVNLMAGAVTGPMRGLLDAVYVSQTVGGDGKYSRPTFDNAVAGKDDDAAMDRTRDTLHTYVVALANWNLPEWVSSDVPPAWRREQWVQFSEIEAQIRAWMGERRRLLSQRLLSPARSTSANLELEIRIEELNVLLESWTGVALPALPAVFPRFENPTGEVE